MKKAPSWASTRGVSWDMISRDIDGDLLGEVALGDGGRHLGDVADLVGQVVRHPVHRVGEGPPGPRDTLHLGLTPELAFRTDLAGDTGDLVGEGGELVHHRV